MRRSWIATLALAVITLAGPAAAEPSHSPGVSGIPVHTQLLEGNNLFVSGRTLKHNFVSERMTLVEGQHPYAVILACADSRVAPEILFDESLGRLFVVRVAGNVVDPDVLGSIEYAAEHLHTHYLLVMGHDACGAVSATLAGGEVPANVGALASHIAPAVEVAKHKGLDQAGTLDAAVRENVRLQMAEVQRQSRLLAELIHKKELAIEGAVYHLDSGRVEWLTPLAK
jgi:carbonic anhydrase